MPAPSAGTKPSRSRSHGRLDFYCAPGRLAVEVDGSQHYTSTGLADDALRTLYLRAAGVRVLRFTNVEVLATSRA